MQQAAVLHFDVGPLAIGEGADAGGQIDDAEAAEQIGQFALVGDDFGDAGQRGDFLRRPRGVAAHHDDSRARDFAPPAGESSAGFWNRLRA